MIVIVAAILTSLVREMTPWVSQYKSNIEAYISKTLGVPVTIGDVETGWYWLKPVIKFHHVNIQGKSENDIKLHRFFLGINSFSSLWNWRLEPGILYVDHLKVDLIQVEGRWHLVGIPLSLKFPSIGLPGTNNPAPDWITNEPRVALRNITVNLHFESGKRLSLEHVNLYSAKRWGRYRIKGSAWLEKPDKKKPVYLELIVDLSQGNFNKLDSLDGELYVSIDGVTLGDWQAYFPKNPYQVRQGQGSVQFWGNLEAGKIPRIQSSLKLKNVLLQDVQTKEKIFVNDLKGNVLWNKNSNGYTLSADQVNLNLNGKRWPENQLQVTYDDLLKEYKLYVHYILIESLLKSVKFSSFSQVGQVLGEKFWSKVKGTLESTQIQIKNAAPIMFLSRFNDVGWESVGVYPCVQALSGALFWQPEEGKVALDGQKSVIRMPHQKPETLENFNGTFSWNKIAQGYRYELKDLLIKKTDFILKGHAVFDPQNAQDAGGQIDVSAQWAAVNAQQWLAFIPKNVFKKKLELWLTKDIKRIDTLDGQLEIHGPLHHFPFDKDPGTFVVNVQVAGMDLFFAPGWPIVHDLKGTLNQNARNMRVEIEHANLAEIPVRDIRLWIDNIGLNHEIMHVHGEMDSSLDSGKSYILSSPLKKRLKFLEQMDGKGDIGLTLDLAAPLYPEDDDVKARGIVNFKDNSLIIHHRSSRIDLQHVKGSLNFQDTGVKESQLSAVFLNSPVSIVIDSVKKPKPATTLRMLGKTAVNSLAQWIPKPLLELISGQFNWEISLMVPVTSYDFENIRFQSDLKGLKVNLSPPFGKSHEEVKPLQVNMQLKKDPKNIGYIIDYANNLHLDLQKTGAEWVIQLKQAMMDAKVIYKPDLNQLSGIVAHLYLPTWNKNQSGHSPLAALMPKDLPQMDLDIQDVRYGKLKLGQMAIKGSYQKPAWVLQDLQINAAGYHGRVTGRWIKTSQKQQTALVGQLKLQNLAQNLATWDVTQALDAKQAEIGFDAQWPGDIFDVSLGKLNADFRVVLRQGVISKLSKETEEKLGLGKLLSILSLQTLPRRLTLDFSDLANKGYTFDIFEGRFKLSRGLMTTQDSYMDGPVAYASMKGTIDLNKRLYDLSFKIAPHITASLPVVATIAGGPVAGLATWFVSKMINKMQQITAYTYKLSGSWDAPVVEPVHLYKAKKK